MNRPDLTLGILDPHVEKVPRPVAIHPGANRIWRSRDRSQVSENDKVVIYDREVIGQLGRIFARLYLLLCLDKRSVGLIATLPGAPLLKGDRPPR